MLLILAWYQASHAQWEKRVKNGVKIRKIWASEARPAAAQRWPPFLLSRLPLGTLRSPIFSSNGEAGPGFKYEFINRLPLPRFFFQVLVNEQEENIQRR